MELESNWKSERGRGMCCIGKVIFTKISKDFSVSGGGEMQ